jgi:hypothetical protein
VHVGVRKNANQENERNQYAPGGKSATKMPFAPAAFNTFGRGAQ